MPRSILIGQTPQPVQFAGLLVRAGHDVIATSSPDDPLADWSTVQGIPHFPGLDGLTSFCRGAAIDYLFSVVNYRMIPARLLQLPTQLAINYHDGPLPRYAGLHATSWALLNQEAVHGITWHVMEDAPDTGDILKQVAVPISPQETALSLNTKCFLAAGRSFQALLKELRDGTISRTPQDLSQRSYFGRKTPLPEIDATWSTDRVDAYRRAMDFGSAANPFEGRIPASALEQMSRLKSTD